MPSLYFILGQTATGKTTYAVQLAKKLDGELINCDSRQIYKHLNIVTGKSDNPQDIPVHMVDYVEPTARYTAFEYAKEAYEVVEKTISRGKVPIVVGGTGLYAYTLLHYSPSKNTHCPKRQLMPAIESSFTSDKLSTMDKPALQEILTKINKDVFVSMNMSDQENPRRLISKIVKLTQGGGEVISKDAPDTIQNKYTPAVRLFLHTTTEHLVDKIITRVRARMKDGALEEARKIRVMGYTANSPGLRTIGYPTLYKYLDGSIDENALISEWVTKERQYAKRQRTYFLKYFPSAELNYI